MPRIDLSERAGMASRIGRWATTAALVVGTLLALGAKDARAEVYGEIHYCTTLAELREMFPNAKIEENRLAWLKPNEANYRVWGVGISGSIGVNFVKIDRPLAPPEERLWAWWVLWVPESPIPLARFVAKYGSPDEAGYEADSMTPYRKWTKIAVRAHLTADEKSVMSVGFFFTDEEREAGKKIVEERLKEKSGPPLANPQN